MAIQLQRPFPRAIELNATYIKRNHTNRLLYKIGIKTNLRQVSLFCPKGLHKANKFANFGVSTLSLQTHFPEESLKSKTNLLPFIPNIKNAIKIHQVGIFVAS